MVEVMPEQTINIEDLKELLVMDDMRFSPYPKARFGCTGEDIARVLHWPKNWMTIKADELVAAGKLEKVTCGGEACYRVSFNG